MLWGLLCKTLYSFLVIYEVRLRAFGGLQDGLRGFQAVEPVISLQGLAGVLAGLLCWNDRKPATVFVDGAGPREGGFGGLLRGWPTYRTYMAMARKLYSMWSPQPFRSAVAPFAASIRRSLPTAFGCGGA